MQKIGEVLMAAGLISETQLSAALGEQARWGNRLGETLVQLGFLAEASLIRVLSERTGFPGVDLQGRTIAPDVLALIPAEIAQKHTCLPVEMEQVGGQDILYVAMEDPSNLIAVDDLTFRTGCSVKAWLAGPLQLRRAISLCYDGIDMHDAAVVLEISTELGQPMAGAAGVADGLLEENWLDDLVEPDAPPAEAAASSAPTGDLAEAASTGSGGKPRDVPSRQILQALTRLLIEKGVITRNELMAEIRQLAEKG
ncbi:MAG: hypothetical protein CL910_04645 [Deltaproteobacteria bacterium]|nr:hypothetical protein [Deltaproteobacteria bacterium]